MKKGVEMTAENAEFSLLYLSERSDNTQAAFIVDTDLVDSKAFAETFEFEVEASTRQNLKIIKTIKIFKGCYQQQKITPKLVN